MDLLASVRSEMGYFVFRFDTHGIGDSEGDLGEGEVYKYHVAIETGLFAQDTIDATDFFLKKVGLQKTIQIGICGGALTSMFAASMEKRIVKIVHIAGPIMLSSKLDAGYNHPWNAKNFLGLYKRKIINLNSWLRFLTGKKDL